MLQVRSDESARIGRIFESQPLLHRETGQDQPNGHRPRHPTPQTFARSGRNSSLRRKEGRVQNDPQRDRVEKGEDRGVPQDHRGQAGHPGRGKGGTEGVPKV